MLSKQSISFKSNLLKMFSHEIRIAESTCLTLTSHNNRIKISLFIDFLYSLNIELLDTNVIKNHKNDDWNTLSCSLDRICIE